MRNAIHKGEATTTGARGRRQMSRHTFEVIGVLVVLAVVLPLLAREIRNLLRGDY